MDAIAKFIGYVVLVVAGLAWWGQHDEKEKARNVVAVDRCTTLETAQLVNRIAPELLAKTQDFGNNIKPTVASCQFFAEKDTMLMSLAVGWNGPLTGDYYEKTGRLTVDAQGWRWEESGANDNLRAYRLFAGIVGALIAASDSPAPAASTPMRLELRNACDHPVRLALAYQDGQGRWRGNGWYVVQAGQTQQFLDDASQVIHSGAARWYYYAETTDDSPLVWKGEHTRQVGEQALPMREALSTDGSGQWRISCA